MNITSQFSINMICKIEVYWIKSLYRESPAYLKKLLGVAGILEPQNKKSVPKRLQNKKSAAK